MMASTWIRLKLHYLGNVRISRVITPIILLAAVFAIFRWLRGPSLGLVMYKNEAYGHRMQASEIQEYMEAMQDTRPQQCWAEFYPLVRQRKPKVSILLDFHADQLYDLKLTLTSIIEHTPEYLYEEILVLDDGTPSREITRHAAEFIKDGKFKKVKAYRSKDRAGQAVTRFKASRVALGDIFVFVSSRVVVNQGWMEPLLEAVLEYQDRIVVPHSENFLSEKRFFQLDNNLVSTFTWPLSTVYTESSDVNPTLLSTPVMRGDAMAVHRIFLESIGGYDEGFQDGDGHDLELSLRTWLCGGEIKVAICSRVATHSALKPMEISNPANYRRVVELWLNDYKDIVYKQGNVEGKLPDEERKSLQIRKSYLRQEVPVCKDFAWYLGHVAQDVFAPSKLMVGYGKLQAMTSHCVRSLSDDSPAVDMVMCRPYMYDAKLIFELDRNGYIRRGDRCLRTSSKGEVSLAPCQERNEKQQWHMQPDGQLSIVAFRQCLTHVTTSKDPDGHFKHNYLVLSDCSSSEDERRQKWTFISY